MHGTPHAVLTPVAFVPSTEESWSEECLMNAATISDIIGYTLPLQQAIKAMGRNLLACALRARGIGVYEEEQVRNYKKGLINNPFVACLSDNQLVSLSTHNRLRMISTRADICSFLCLFFLPLVSLRVAFAGFAIFLFIGWKAHMKSLRILDSILGLMEAKGISHKMLTEECAWLRIPIFQYSGHLPSQVVTLALQLKQAMPDLQIYIEELRFSEGRAINHLLGATLNDESYYFANWQD